jgi:hypothetical protein
LPDKSASRPVSPLRRCTAASTYRLPTPKNDGISSDWLALSTEVESSVGERFLGIDEIQVWTSFSAHEPKGRSSAPSMTLPLSS